MESPSPTPSGIKFGIFEADIHNRELRKGGVRIKLQDQPFAILQMLLENAGQIVSRDQIRQQLWPADTFVDFDHSLNTAINRLREVLGDAADNSRFIETVPRRGYRFVAPVEIPTKPGPATVEPGSMAAPPAAVLRHRFRWPALLFAGVVLLAAAAWTFWPRRTIDSLAVVPFANTTGDATLDYLSDGLSEGLMNDLATLPDLKVIARNSVFHYKGKDLDPQKIARDLGVRTLLTGSMSRHDDDLIFSVELLDAPDNRHLWGERFTRKVSDPLDIERDIAREVSSQLRSRLGNPGKSTQHSTDNKEAYDLYLQGQYQLNKRTLDGLTRGSDFFQQAIRKDPDYALAYVGLANAYGLLRFYGGIDPTEARRKGTAAGKKALELDPGLAEAHVQEGYLLLDFWDPGGAEKEFRKAIELNLNSALAHHAYSLLLSSLGRQDEALAQNRIVQELDPLWPGAFGSSVWILGVYSDQYEKARQAAARAMALDPDFPPTHWGLGLIYEDQGNYPLAIAEFQNAQSGNSPIATAMLGHVYAVAGEKAKALQILSQLQKPRQDHYVSPYGIAVIYAGLGNKDEALAWLSRAYEENDPWLQRLKIDRRLKPLHSEPRFQALLRKTGLAN